MHERAKKVLRFAVTGALLGSAGAASGCESLNRLINGEEPSVDPTHEEPRYAPNPGPNELEPPQPEAPVEPHPNLPYVPPPEGPTVPELPHPNAAPVDPPPPSPEPNG